VLAFILFVLLAPSWAFASDQSEGEEAPQPQVGASPPRLDDTRGSVGFFGGASTANADGLESGTQFGGSGAFYFSRNLGVEVGVQRRGLDLVGTSSNALSGGSFDSTVMTGSLLVRFPVTPRVAPYLVAGVAYFSNTYEVDPAIVNELSALNFRLTEEAENKLGFNLGGGVDVLLASRFGVFGEVRYLAASTDTRAELADTVSGIAVEDAGGQDLNGLAISAGVRVFF
jgi:opacity protein-like surface antigen